MFRRKQYSIVISLLLVPILLFSMDSDLAQMNSLDNKKIKASSVLFTTRAGYAYSEWKMQNMSLFKQETQGLNLAWVDLIYKGSQNTIEGVKNYLHYERSFNKNWNEKIIYQEDAIKDNYELISGRMTAPFIYHTLGNDKTFFIEASMERYLSRISSKGNTNFIDKSGESYRLNFRDSLVFETKFNEVILGITQMPGLESFFFFDDYQKPFTIRKNNKEIQGFNHYLYYSKIKTYGVGVKLGGTEDSKSIWGTSFKIGRADIELIDDLRLIDLNFKQSTYFQFKLKLGYLFTPIDAIKNFNITVLASYDIRYFNEPNAEGKTTLFSTEGGTNKDDIMKAFVSLQYSF